MWAAGASLSYGGGWILGFLVDFIPSEYLGEWVSPNDFTVMPGLAVGQRGLESFTLPNSLFTQHL